MSSLRIGFAFCGSFCTYTKAINALEQIKSDFGDVTPIVSEHGAELDTRFGNAHDFLMEMERICNRRVIATIQAAEPIGPKKMTDIMVVAPASRKYYGKISM